MEYFSQHMGPFENWKISLGYSLVLAGHIQSRDASRPIVCEQKCFMDYKKRMNGTLGGERRVKYVRKA